MPTTPSWEAARNGPPGNLDATNHASQVGQFLGAHNITTAYDTGRFILPFGSANLTWVNYSNQTDLSQRFTVPSGVGTSIVRVSLPLLPSGNGADVLVSLYPDNSGSPDTTNLLASTMLPAAWINALAAPNGVANGGPLATSRSNTYMGSGGYQSQPWAGPVGDSTGVAQNSSVASSGNYMITAGGTTTAGVVPVVNTIPYLGGTSMGRGIPQPPLPAATYYGMLAATTDSLVYAGGLTTPTGLTPTTSVWVASWDSNTGTVGSWSSQTALPTAVYAAGVTSSGGTMYVIGGTSGSAVQSTVYYATVTNGQISSWNAGPTLPTALAATMCTAVNGWLVVAGGNTSPTVSVSGATIVGTSYFAKIQPDGSLSAWQSGPGTQPMASYAPGWDVTRTDSAAIFVGGFAGSGAYSQFVQVWSIDSNGPGTIIQFFDWREAGVEMVAAFSTGTPGQWLLVNTNIPDSEYFYTTLTPVPWISVPLAATLTTSATYHVVLQQRQTGSPGDHVSFGLLDGSPIGPDALKSPRHSGTWTSALGSGWGMPITVYNNQPIRKSPFATWEDPAGTGSNYTSNLASRISSTIFNWQFVPVGYLESSLLPNEPLNSNPTFTAGTSPWVAHNGTLSQSSAQVHGGFPFSGLLTPAGGTATASATSELVPIQAVYPLWSNGQWYQVNGWLYSPTGWSSVSLSVDWYDATSTYISTSSNTVALAAATWTNLVNAFQPPTTAAFASINVTESGTPAGTNTLYLSNVTLTLSPELTGSLAAVSEITYAGGTWPPINITQLA